jgi:restriction endonuclease S subunit
MMSEWKEYKLGDLVSVNERSIGKGFDYSIIEYIDTSSVTENKFDPPTITKIDEAPSRAKRLIRDGDTIVSTVRPIQKHYGFIKNAKSNQVVSTGFAVVTPKKIDPRFLFYFLTQESVTEYLNTLAEGGTTTFPAFRADELKELNIFLPPLPTQTAIASILSSLDDKIELNKAINKNLEALAQALFKQWFVDFEFPCLPENYCFQGHVNQASESERPEDFESVITYKRVGGLPVPDGKSWFVYVLLCNNGSFYKGITNDLYRRFYEHYKGIGAKWTSVHRPVKVIHWELFDSKKDAAQREKELKTGYGRTWLERQYAKFDNGSPAPECKLRMAGEMVESELGMIPKGWRVGVLNDVLIVKGGTTPSTKEPLFWDGDYNWSSPRDLSNLQFPVLLKTEKRITEAGLRKISSGLLPRGTLLLSSRAPIGYMAITEIETAINQGYIAINCKHDFSNLFMLYWLRQNMASVIERANGSTFLEVSKSNFKEINIVIPSRELHKFFIQTVEPAFRHLIQNVKENFELTLLRDNLLPKLISGELEVNEALSKTEKAL